jgi:hypothetical protein
MKTALLVAVAVVAAAPLYADAQSFRCVGKDGSRHYGSTVPPECYGRPVEQLNKQGMVVKRIDPQAEEKQRLAKEAAEARKRREEAAAREANRRRGALLATYTSERDIEDARARALAENVKAVRDVETRIEAIRKRQSAAKLPDEMQSAENDLKANLQLLEAKKREANAINARYDEDRKDYLEITGKR